MKESIYPVVGQVKADPRELSHLAQPSFGPSRRKHNDIYNSSIVEGLDRVDQVEQKEIALTRI